MHPVRAGLHLCLYCQDGSTRVLYPEIGKQIKNEKG